MEKQNQGLFTIEKIARGLEVSVSELLVDLSVRHAILQERVSLIERMNEYDQRLVDAILESF